MALPILVLHASKVAIGASGTITLVRSSAGGRSVLVLLADIGIYRGHLCRVTEIRVFGMVSLEMEGRTIMHVVHYRGNKVGDLLSRSWYGRFLG